MPAISDGYDEYSGLGWWNLEKFPALVYQGRVRPNNFQVLGVPV